MARRTSRCIANDKAPVHCCTPSSLTLIAASLITAAMLPAAAQNSVPPTAVQAAKMPQFASHLAPPAKRPAPLNPAARAKSRPGPRDSSDIYDNGPINGNTDAWTIDFGFIVGDTFYLANNGTEVTGMSFGAWLSPGDTLTSAELSITSSPFSGTSYFDQTVNFTQGSCTVNEYGYNVCTETASFSGPTLNAGTYWVNLQNASVPSGDPAYWDENSGVGCTGTGCPSQADENEVGTIPSESFTILGNATTTNVRHYTERKAGSAASCYVCQTIALPNYPSALQLHGKPGDPDAGLGD